MAKARVLSQISPINLGEYSFLLIDLAGQKNTSAVDHLVSDTPAQSSVVNLPEYQTVEPVLTTFVNSGKS